MARPKNEDVAMPSAGLRTTTWMKDCETRVFDGLRMKSHASAKFIDELLSKESDQLDPDDYYMLASIEGSTVSSWKKSKKYQAKEIYSEPNERYRALFDKLLIEKEPHIQWKIVKPSGWFDKENLSNELLRLFYCLDTISIFTRKDHDTNETMALRTDRAFKLVSSIAQFWNPIDGEILSNGLLFPSENEPPNEQTQIAKINDIQQYPLRKYGQMDGYNYLERTRILPFLINVLFQVKLSEEVLKILVLDLFSLAYAKEVIVEPLGNPRFFRGLGEYTPILLILWRLFDNETLSYESFDHATSWAEDEFGLTEPQVEEVLGAVHSVLVSQLDEAGTSLDAIKRIKSSHYSHLPRIFEA